MGQIYLYNSLDTKKNVIRASGKLRDILPDYDFSKAVLLNNGNRIDPDYMVGENDSVFIRTIPSGSAVAVVAIVVSVIAAGAAIGTAIYAAIQNQKLQNELNKAQKQANADNSVEELPFLKGAKNKTALGNSIQYVMGEMFNTPYKLYAGHYSLSGTEGQDQYWNAILCLGYSDQVVKSVSIGDVKILDRSYDRQPQNGIYSVDSGIYSAPQNMVEIRNGQEFTTEDFKQKVIAVACGDEIDWPKEDENPTPLIKQLESNCMGVDVEIEFPGLRQMDDDGDWNPYTVKVVPSWSNDNGATWNEFTFNQNGTLSNDFKYNSSKTIRFVAHKDFSASESFGKTIQIKLERKTKKKGNGKTQDSVRCGYYQTYCYDAKKSSSSRLVSCPALTEEFTSCTARIGLHFIANDSTSGELNEINAMTCGMARTWNGSSWSVEKSVTRNPAAWALEILTSGVHQHSKYSDSEIDLESFGALYEYCEEQNLYCDGILTKGEKKFDLVGKILSECFSTLIRNKENKLEVCVDKEESIPVALINSQSVISSTITKSFERQIDGKKVTFVNRENWQPDTMYVMRDGSNVKNDEKSATELAMNFVTTPEHAWKVAQRQLLKASLQPKEIKINVGHEGDWYPLYSTLKVQLPQMRIGNVSTVLHAIDTENRRIELADYVTFEAGKTYGIIIEARSGLGKIEYDVPVTGNGTTNIVNYSEGTVFDFNFVKYGNLVSFGELEDGSFSKVTNVMKITGIDSNEDGVQLTLRDYSPDIYKWESGLPIPEFKSNLTAQNNSFSPAVSRPLESSYVDEQVSFVRLQASADAAAKIEAAQLEGSPMYSAMIDTSVIRKISETEYSPNAITGVCTKQTFSETGVPLDPEEYPCDWKITVNDIYVATISRSPRVVITVADLIVNIKDTYHLASLNLKKINIKATSSANELVVWDEENIPILSNDGSYVFELENEYQVYECYSEVDGVVYDNGYIKTERESFVTPHLYMGLTELTYGTDWVYEIIPEVPGFEVSLRQARAIDGTLVIKALEGADMEVEGSIKIPVFIRTSSTIDVGIGYTDESGEEITVGYTDAGGNEYTVGYVAPGENSGIIMLSFSWKKLTETAARLDSSEKVLASFADDGILSIVEKRTVSTEMEKIRNEHSFYQSKYSALTSYPAYDSAYGSLVEYIEPLLSDMTISSPISRTEYKEKFNAYYSAVESIDKERSDNPTYTFVQNQSLPENPKYGDWFLCGKSWGNYKLGMIYTYNGSSWVADNDTEKVMTSMNDALGILQSNTDGNIPAVSFCQKLIAMNAVIQNLASTVITLQSGGLIQSEGFGSGQNGFQIKADGKATFRGGSFNDIDSNNAKFSHSKLDYCDIEYQKSSRAILNNSVIGNVMSIGVLGIQNDNYLTYSQGISNVIKISDGKYKIIPRYSPRVNTVFGGMSPSVIVDSSFIQIYDGSFKIVKPDVKVTDMETDLDRGGNVWITSVTVELFHPNSPTVWKGDSMLSISSLVASNFDFADFGPNLG